MSAFLDSGRRYELCGLLGRGGLGEVLLAIDTQLDRKVAIKRLYQDPDATAETAAAAIREARVLASLLHPNVVAVFDIFEFLGDILVVMEYVPGRTLQEVGDFAPVALSDFLSVASQSLRGLAAAHELNLLHFDIKPSNIMVAASPSSGWKVKVLDFGLAKLVEATHVRTPDDQERELLGSIYTMAPEQFEEDPVDARTDLYSLGCVLYFVLAGGYPFVGDSVEDVVSAHLSQTCIPIGEARPDLPDTLADWVMKLMARKPEDRFQTAYDAFDELRLIMKALPELVPA